MDWAPQAIREGILTILFISGPLVVLAAMLGLSVGILQAATQIQEQTLASAVKILGLFTALIIGGFFMFAHLQRFATRKIERAFRLIPSLGTYVKPRRNFLTVTEEDVSRDQIKYPSELEEPLEPNKKSPRLAGMVNEPDTEFVNIGKKPDVLGMPENQIKEEDKNIKKQDMNVIELPPGQRANNQAAAPQTQTPQTQTPQTQVPQTQAPQAQAPAAQEATTTPRTKPARPSRKSLSDALSRIRDSIDEVQGETP